MRKSPILLLLILSLLTISNSGFANNGQLPDTTIHQLEQKSQYKDIILTLPDEQYQKNKQRYIALDPSTKIVSIEAQDIQYTEEAESFARHRRHYVAFWTLFLFMFGVDILWDE